MTYAESDMGPPQQRPVHGTGGRGAWWFTICILTLILASDYKLRTRDPRAVLAGGIDTGVLIELALYGLVGLYLIVVHARPPRLGRTPPHLYLATFFIGLLLLSVAYTAYPQYALVRAGQMCVLLGVVLAAAATATRADLHRFAHAYVVTIALSIAYGVIVPSPPVSRLQEGRFTWLAIHPTVSGVLAGIATVVVAAYLIAGRRTRPGPMWPRGVYGAAFVVIGGGMLAVQTRGAVVGALAGIVVLLLTARGGRMMVNLLPGLVAAVAAAVIAAGGVIVTYFERGEDAEQLASLNSRTDLWDTAADAIANQPMFGYGVTSSRGIFYDDLGLGGGHNAIVNVLVELGIVGLVCWVALVGALVLGIKRLPARGGDMRIDRALLLAVVTFLMVDGLFFEGPGSVTNVASTWFFVCIAWLSVAARSRDTRRSRADGWASRSPTPIPLPTPAAALRVRSWTASSPPIGAP